AAGEARRDGRNRIQEHDLHKAVRRYTDLQDQRRPEGIQGAQETRQTIHEPDRTRPIEPGRPLPGTKPLEGPRSHGATPQIPRELFESNGDLDTSAFTQDARAALEAAVRFCHTLNWDEMRSPLIFLGLVSTGAGSIESLFQRSRYSREKVAEYFAPL